MFPNLIGGSKDSQSKKKGEAVAIVKSHGTVVASMCLTCKITHEDNWKLKGSKSAPTYGVSSKSARNGLY